MKGTLLNVAVVGAGGFIGAVCRYGLSGFVQRWSGFAAFPYGTLVVNMLGCLLIGIGVGLFDTRPLMGQETRLFLLVGILGGFTTYSTFGLETFALLREAEFLRAMANVLVHVIGGLAMVWLGYLLTAR